MSEIISGIRIIKISTWELSFSKLINSLRRWVRAHLWKAPIAGSVLIKAVFKWHPKLIIMEPYAWNDTLSQIIIKYIHSFCIELWVWSQLQFRTQFVMGLPVALWLEHWTWGLTYVVDCGPSPWDFSVAVPVLHKADYYSLQYFQWWFAA